MKYNFDEIVDRQNTNSLNTDGFRGYIFHAGPEKVFPYKDEEFVRKTAKRTDELVALALQGEEEIFRQKDIAADCL